MPPVLTPVGSVDSTVGQRETLGCDAVTTKPRCGAALQQGWPAKSSHLEARRPDLYNHPLFGQLASCLQVWGMTLSQVALSGWEQFQRGTWE